MTSTLESVRRYHREYMDGVRLWNSLPGSVITESFLDSIRTCYCKDGGDIRDGAKNMGKYCHTCGYPPKKQ